MLKCPYCYEVILEKAAKCPHCRQFIIDEVIEVDFPSLEKKRCHFCGKKINSEAVVCRFCGQWLNEIDRAADDLQGDI